MINCTVSKTGIKCWYNRGLIHRLNGPARIWADGYVDYWVNGNRISEYEHMFISGSI